MIQTDPSWYDLYVKYVGRMKVNVTIFFYIKYVRWAITATAITKRNTANKENLTNKNVLLTYKKGLVSSKQHLLTYTKKDLVTNTNDKKPRQILTANSCGKFLRKISTTNSRGKEPWQILAANSRGKFSNM